MNDYAYYHYEELELEQKRASEGLTPAEEQELAFIRERLAQVQEEG